MFRFSKARMREMKSLKIFILNSRQEVGISNILPLDSAMSSAYSDKNKILQSPKK